MRARRVAVSLLPLFAALPGSARAQWLALRVPDRPEPASAEAGHAIYETHCWYCHGDEGDGRGPIAEYLWPRPRDFTIASYKLRTTGSGELPTDEDLFRTVTLGLPGTAMPAWGSALTPEERWQVIAYIKTFAGGLFEDEAFDPYDAIVPLGEEPDAPAESLIAAGRELYERSDCWECHGAAGRGDGAKAPDLEDDRGYPARATDLEDPSRFKGGSTARDVYARLSTGLDGTPMPSYAASLGDEERWQVARYVASLARRSERETRDGAVIPARPIEGPLPSAGDDERWDAAPRAWIPLTGQATFPPRWQAPSVSGLSVRALYDAREVALRLRWNDGTADSRPPDSSRAREEGWSADDTYPRLFPDGARARGAYADAVELVLPARPGDPPRLPHFVYGDAERPVELWRWSADRERGGGPSAAVVELHAVGPERPPQIQPPDRQRASGRGTFVDGRWTVVLRHSLDPADAGPDRSLRPGGRIPIAFHVWDGSHGETGLRMALSSWYFLHLREPATASSYLLVVLATVGTLLAEGGAVLWMQRQAAEGRLDRYLEG